MLKNVKENKGISIFLGEPNNPYFQLLLTHQYEPYNNCFLPKLCVVQFPFYVS